MERCEAMTRRGERCRRLAMPGQSCCARHQDKGSPARGIYADYFTQDELGELAALANSADIGAEIALLRVMIRRAVREGADLPLIVRGVDALGRALKVQYGVSGRAAKSLEEAVARVLDEIGNELGMTL
ncbi:MAG: hypothetical protein HYX89_07260 [Chloroflexi bacterium]|nr:hypothetical protein [Chloroflexota bacterium]